MLNVNQVHKLMSDMVQVQILQILQPCGLAEEPCHPLAGGWGDIGDISAATRQH